MPFSIKLLLQLNLNKPPLFEAFWGKDQDGFFNLCNHLINEGPVDI